MAGAVVKDALLHASAVEAKRKATLTSLAVMKSPIFSEVDGREFDVRIACDACDAGRLTTTKQETNRR